MRCDSVSFGELLRAVRKETVACTFKNRVLIVLLYDESPNYIRNVGNLTHHARTRHHIPEDMNPLVVSVPFTVPTS